MQRTWQRTGRVFRWVLPGWTLLLAATVGYADDLRQVDALSQDELWRRTINFAVDGDFDAATETIKKVHIGGHLTEQVRTWLEAYEAKQVSRKELDRADFEKYVGYAKARIERKEYRLALTWALAALDCAENRDKFLQSAWLQDLVNDALVAADGFRKKSKWRNAWRIYAHLSALFEHEPRYQKLEREALTHLRLDAMFKEDSHWEEGIERVRWKDAREALDYVDRVYVQVADFKKITESGLEQLLMLAESGTAQDEFEGLGNEDDRRDFELRIQERLDQVRAAPELNVDDCIDHFHRVIKVINKETVRLPEELVVSELVRGAFEPLDDFTTVIWPRDSKEFDKHTRGDFVGVGISIIKNRAGEVEVVSPLEDSSAYRAGVQAGDIITKVDGQSLKNISLNKVVDTITGRKGSMVTLTIRRNEKEIDFPLKRAKVKIRSVKGIRRDPVDEERWDHWLDPDLGVGYIRVTNFQRNTVEDVDNVLSELAPRLEGLILDLRSNPGGLLDSAWQLSTRFLDRGDVIVSTKGRLKSEDHIFRAPGDGPYPDVPLVVLVDDRSASASEIVSGAVRDNNRGVVIGERTFGKFSVQNLIGLGRSGAKLKITTASYYLPNGDSLHRDPTAETWGVEPDVPVRLAAKERSKVYQMWRKANLLGPPKSPAEDEPSDDAADEQEADEEGLEDEATGDDPADPGAEEGSEGESSGEDDEESDKEKLPPLKQPDPNDRPEEDPQLDAALLLMRATLVGELYPTLATADMKEAIESAKP